MAALNDLNVTKPNASRFIISDGTTSHEAQLNLEKRVFECPTISANNPEFTLDLFLALDHPITTRKVTLAEKGEAKFSDAVHIATTAPIDNFTPLATYDSAQAGGTHIFYSMGSADIGATIIHENAAYLVVKKEGQPCDATMTPAILTAIKHELIKTARADA